MLWNSNKLHTELSVVVLSIFLTSCSPSDNERCGNGFVWEDNTCVLIEEESTDTGTDSDSDTYTDSDTDSDTDIQDGGLPSGLGEPCTEDGGECEGLEASYCTINPFSGDGYCTVQNCATVPNDCPPGYLCCDFPPSIELPNFCATEADFKEMGAMCNG